MPRQKAKGKSIKPEPKFAKPKNFRKRRNSRRKNPAAEGMGGTSKPSSMVSVRHGRIRSLPQPKVNPHYRLKAYMQLVDWQNSAELYQFKVTSLYQSSSLFNAYEYAKLIGFQIYFSSGLTTDASATPVGFTYTPPQPGENSGSGIITSNFVSKHSDVVVNIFAGFQTGSGAAIAYASRVQREIIVPANLTERSSIHVQYNEVDQAFVWEKTLHQTSGLILFEIKVESGDVSADAKHDTYVYFDFEAWRPGSVTLFTPDPNGPKDLSLNAVDEEALALKRANAMLETLANPLDDIEGFCNITLDTPPQAK